MLFANFAYMMLSVEPVAACICIWAAGEELEFRCVAHYLAAGNSEVKLELAAGNILFFVWIVILPILPKNEKATKRKGKVRWGKRGFV